MYYKKQIAMILVTRNTVNDLAQMVISYRALLQQPEIAGQMPELTIERLDRIDEWLNGIRKNYPLIFEEVQE